MYWKKLPPSSEVPVREEQHGWHFPAASHSGVPAVRPCTSVLTPTGAHTPWTRTTDPLLVRGFPLSTPRLTLCPLGLLIDLTCYKLPNLAAIAVKNGTLKDSISVYLPLINIGLLSLDLIYLPLEQVHYYVLGRYDIFMEIWGLFMEYIKIK